MIEILVFCLFCVLIELWQFILIYAATDACVAGLLVFETF